jgi:hypothetical protein
MNNEQQLREEFKKYALADEIDDLSFHELLDETADWWLSKIKSHTDMLVEKVEVLIKTSGKSLEYEAACWDFISLLKGTLESKE